VLALVGSQPVRAASNPVLVVAGLTETTSQLQTILHRLSADGFTAVGMRLPGAIAGCGDIAQSSQAVANRARQRQSQAGAANPNPTYLLARSALLGQPPSTNCSAT